MPEPKITLSALTYYYNESRFLKAQIQSVLDALDEVTEPVEFVLLDNASTDDSRAIAHSFTDPRIRFVDCDLSISGPDYDFAKENTIGFQHCRGKYVSVVGGDDICHPEKFVRALEAFAADPKLDMVHHGCAHIDAEGNLLPSCFVTAPYHQWNFLRIAFTYLQIAYPSVTIRRSALGDFQGGYAPDFWLWLDVAQKWRFRYLGDDPLLWYRVHDRSASHSPDGGRRCSEASVKIRAAARAKYSIDDFFPEITLCADKDKARCAAHLELGNMMLGGGMANIQLAFDEYKKADLLWPDHPALVYNAAVIMSLDGQRDGALAALATLPDSPMVSRARCLASGLLGGPFTLSDGRGISEELYAVKLPAELWRSNG